MFQDYWEYVNLRKAVLPKLWSFLKHGGHGNAMVIYPSLLPFLSRIPSKVSLRFLLSELFMPTSHAEFVLTVREKRGNLSFPIWKPAPGNGGRWRLRIQGRMQISLIECNLVSYFRTRQVMLYHQFCQTA